MLVLLAAALASYRFDLGERWLGWSAADPATQPAAVAPPEGLQLPEVGAAAPIAAAAPGRAADPAKVAAALAPMIDRASLGPHFSLLVTDLDSGAVTYRAGAPTVTPASTLKLLTAVAALEVLGPMHRFTTTVRWDAAARELVLVGGGDPFLVSSPKQARGTYPQRADLATLAQQTAVALRDQGPGPVRLRFDDSLFTGPTVNPAWPATYRPEQVVPPISALWADQGHLPGRYGFSDDPSATATDIFAAALRRAGVQVRPRIERSPGPGAATELTSVSSAPVGEIVERTLAVSDNQAAEVLARHVGIAERKDGSFVGGAAAVLETLGRLGVRTAGDRTFDGSGLSRENVLTPETLAGVLRLAASSQHPVLRQAITGLPVAGFTGSLQWRFENAPVSAKGDVRAKTGTLTGVHGLAGVATDTTGARMGFVLVADRVKPEQSLKARNLIDQMAAALGACTCGVGSAS